MIRARRRKFSFAVERTITIRATDPVTLNLFCEGCGAWLTDRSDYEIDHVIAEGVRPDFRKNKKLTPKDGQLLCRAVCHPRKTRADAAFIAEAKRREKHHTASLSRTEIARRYGL